MENIDERKNSISYATATFVVMAGLMTATSPVLRITGIKNNIPMLFWLSMILVITVLAALFDLYKRYFKKENIGLCKTNIVNFLGYLIFFHIWILPFAYFSLLK